MRVMRVSLVPLMVFTTVDGGSIVAVAVVVMMVLRMVIPVAMTVKRRTLITEVVVHCLALNIHTSVLVVVILGMEMRRVWMLAVCMVMVNMLTTVVNVMAVMRLRRVMRMHVSMLATLLERHMMLTVL